MPYLSENLCLILTERRVKNFFPVFLYSDRTPDMGGPHEKISPMGPSALQCFQYRLTPQPRSATVRLNSV